MQEDCVDDGKPTNLPTDLPTFEVGDYQRRPSGMSRQLMMAKTQHLLFDVAKHFTQVVPKHKLLLLEIDLKKYTATQMVMVRPVKQEAPDQNKLEKDFEKNWEGKIRHVVERCDRRAYDAWEMLSDAYKDAFLKQQNERIDENTTAGKGREPRLM